MYEIEDKKNREQYQMERSAARKDWIKNLAIVFLSIMLILTFFSNTIMNYSLFVDHAHSDLLLKHDHELLASAGGDPVRAGGKHHAQSERFGNR